MENQIKFPSRRHSPLPHLAIGKRRAVTTTAGSIIEHWVQEGAQALFAEGSDRIEWLLIANNECYRWGIWWTIKGRDMVWTGMRGLACSHQLPDSKGGGSAGRQNLCVLDKFVRSSAVFITRATHWKRDERRILRRHHRYSWRTHIIYIYIYIYCKGWQIFRLETGLCNLSGISERSDLIIINYVLGQFEIERPTFRVQEDEKERELCSKGFCHNRWPY